MQKRVKMSTEHWESECENKNKKNATKINVKKKYWIWNKRNKR